METPKSSPQHSKTQVNQSLIFGFSESGSETSSSSDDQPEKRDTMPDLPFGQLNKTDSYLESEPSPKGGTRETFYQRCDYDIDETSMSSKIMATDQGLALIEAPIKFSDFQHQLSVRDLDAEYAILKIVTDPGNHEEML